MPNHPNRGQISPASNPEPNEIMKAREAAGLTQTAAAALVHTSCRAWQQWEAGDRRMHPAFWELFSKKSKGLKKMKASYQNRKGIPEKLAGIIHESLVLTIPVREAFAAAGADVEAMGEGLWRVTVKHTMPSGIVVRETEEGNTALRLEIEPEFDSMRRVSQSAWWEAAKFIPCPECGGALVWYEAGFVPGYRVCTGRQHHHVMVA